MLDHDDGGPGTNQPVQHHDQPGQILGMEAGGGFVEHQQAALERAAAQMFGQLDPLGLAAGERGRILAQGQIAEADVDEGVPMRSIVRRFLSESRSSSANRATASLIGKA